MSDIDSKESPVLWAEQEFGGIALGDARRTNRLVKIAAGKAENPMAAMSLCCNKNDSQSICRLLKRKEVTLDSVLTCHMERTVERCNEENLVYAVQDTSFLDFSTHTSLEGLGKICHGKSGNGLVMHTGLAVTVDKTPLGLLDVEIWSRPDDPEQESEEEKKSKKNSRKYLPLEEKESYKWVRCKNKIEEALGNFSCKVILVSDRESDIFELFASERVENFELLIRANFNRCTKLAEVDNDEEEIIKLFDLMEKTASIGEYELTIPRRKGCKERKTTIIVKSGSAVFMPHKYLKKQGYSEPITLNWVWAIEKDSGCRRDLVNWKLLTTLPVESFAQAKACIDGYSIRWVIEEYHRVLKSGCKIEGLQFETLDTMYPAMGICCAVAWRVLYLSKYARENPDNEAGLVSTELERKVLSGWLKMEKIKDYKVKTVKDFVRGVGILGGLPARKSAGMPGTKTLWLGLRRLDDMVKGFMLAKQIQ